MSKNLQTNISLLQQQCRRQRVVGGGAGPHKKNCPLGGAVAWVFPNVSLAMCPLKLSLAPYLLDSGAGPVLYYSPLAVPYSFCCTLKICRNDHRPHFLLTHYV